MFDISTINPVMDKNVRQLMGQTGVPPADVLVVTGVTGIWRNRNDLTSQRHWNDGEGKGKCPNISLFQVGD